MNIDEIKDTLRAYEELLDKATELCHFYGVTIGREMSCGNAWCDGIDSTSDYISAYDPRAENYDNLPLEWLTRGQDEIKRK